MKKILKSIGLIAFAVVVGLGALFIPFKSKQVVNTASAVDNVLTSYNFISSDTYHFDMVYYNKTSWDGVAPVVWSANISYYEGDGALVLSPDFKEVAVVGNNITTTKFSYLYNQTTGIVAPATAIPLNTGINTLWFGHSSQAVQNGYSFLVEIEVGANFNANVYKVELFLIDKTSYKQFNIRYSDVNDNLLTIRFVCPSNFEYDSRTYFLISDISDNQFYKQGVSDGYSTGLTDGESIGYNKGFQAGETQGFNNGYIDGVESANTYSFLGLIGAVVDAPVSVFSDLFNFELLGVNLLSFFTSLLTFCLCLWVLRLILGGK